MKTPCRDCPFRTDTTNGWLGEDRAAEILAADSFVCHKKTDMQCAGHMLVNGKANAFVRVAAALGISLDISGRDQVFASQSACIQHHKN